MRKAVVIPVAFAAAVLAFAAVGVVAKSPKTITKTVAGPTATATTTATATETDTATETATTTVTARPTVVRVVATHIRTVTVTYTPAPPHQYIEGTYLVGTEIRPGTYRSTGSSDCYWARLSGLSGGLGDIIANHLGAGSQFVTVASSDRALAISGSCTFGRL